MNNNRIDFEINLLPIISLLAVCISFLLLTAVWIHIGSLDVSQAVGTETDKKPTASMWVEFKQNGFLKLKFKDLEGKRKLQPISIQGQNGKIRWKKFKVEMLAAKEKFPQITMALLMPNPSSSYDDIIQMIDEFKKNKINDVGVAPL